MENNIGEIILYCSGTQPDLKFGAECVRCIHVIENKWRDIGYNYVIQMNGAIEHCKMPDGTIRICLAGGLSKLGLPESNFTEEQLQSAQLLISSLVSVYPSITKLSAHDDYDYSTLKLHEQQGAGI